MMAPQAHLILLTIARHLRYRILLPELLTVQNSHLRKSEVNIYCCKDQSTSKISVINKTKQQTNTHTLNLCD